MLGADVSLPFTPQSTPQLDGAFEYLMKVSGGGG
jgi:hypothetical protein